MDRKARTLVGFGVAIALVVVVAWGIPIARGWHFGCNLLGNDKYYEYRLGVEMCRPENTEEKEQKEHQQVARREAEHRAAAEREARQTAATVPGGSIGGDGQIPIPAGIPEVVQWVIAGANAIADSPDVVGSGHRRSFSDTAYDSSGSVSYALAAGGLLSVPETSGQLESWGEPGPGKWITVYANAGHTYMYVNVGGRWMRYDTVGRSGPYASRWQAEIRSNAGFVARHPPGL